MNILTVSQLTAAIKQKLEVAFASITVRGEVSNLRIQSSGHIYFTLKDAGSQVSAVLFKGQSYRLSQPLKEGDQIVITGELSVYVPRGNYQIIVREVEFSGVGELLKKLHALKLKLEGLGWFDPAKKKPLPKLPRTIGVVTSPTGSVIQDMLHILSRRFSGFHLILNPVRVQGELAATEIAQAIKDFNTHQLADVLIVGRGGGSFEDLWPFNEEIVAKAIHESKIPIISAVGHETDFTIADFVADLRAPTPSAAAELVTLEKNQLMLQLQKAKTGILQTMQTHLRTHRRMLDAISKQPTLKSPYTLLASFIQKVDYIRSDLKMALLQALNQNKRNLHVLIRQKEALKPGAQIGVQRKNFEKVGINIEGAFKKQIEQKRRRLQQLTDHLKAIDPRNLLKKGYSIVFHEKNDSVILSIDDIEPDEYLKVQVSNGKIRVKVQETYE